MNSRLWAVLFVWAASLFAIGPQGGSSGSSDPPIDDPSRSAGSGSTGSGSSGSNAESATPGSASPRQSGWVDENAAPAGAVVTPGTSSPKSGVGEVKEVKGEISPSAAEIRQCIGQLADQTLTPGELSRAVGLLSIPDARRVADEISRRDSKPLDEALQQFGAQWKAHYGEEFALTRRPLAMADYRVLRGILSPEAVVASYHEGGELAQRPQDSDAVPAQGKTGGDERNATLVIPPDAQRKLPSLVLRFDNQTTGGVANWHLEPADKLTAEQLERNLLSRVKRLIEQSDNWPVDSREAYRVVAFHVLAAYENQPLDRPGEQAVPKGAEPSMGS